MAYKLQWGKLLAPLPILMLVSNIRLLFRLSIKKHMSASYTKRITDLKRGKKGKTTAVYTSYLQLKNIVLNGRLKTYGPQR